MAKTLLKGIQLVKLSTFTGTPDSQVIYFVRNDNPSGDTKDGYIQFNGKQYGNVAEFCKKKFTGKKINNVALTDANGILQDVTLYSTDITAGSGYTKADSYAAITSADTIAVALGKLEKAIENYLTEVEAGNGIEVTTKANQKQTISAKIKEGDKVLGVDGSGISSSMSFQYDSSSRKILLYGSAQDDTHKIGEVDCSDFIKDGMLWGEKVFKATATTETVSITKGGVTQSHDFSGLTVGNAYMAFCFTNGEASGTTYSWDILDVQDLIDVYTGGNGITVSGNVISAKVVSSNGLSVDADGIKVATATTNSFGTVKIINEITSADTQDTNTVATPKAVAGYSDAKSVNGKSGSTITLDTEDINTTETIGYTNDDITTEIIPSGSTVQEGFQKVVDVIGENEKTTAAAINDIYAKLQEVPVEITSTGNTITITSSNSGNNIEVNTETSTDTTVGEGHIEITKNSEGGLYAAMYYGGDDVLPNT